MSVWLPRASLLIAIDALLLGALLLLLSPRMTGLGVHEWLGMAFGAPVLIHLLMSWRWIEHATVGRPGVFRGRTRVNFAMNAALFTLVVVVLTSGVAISAVALPALHVGTVNDRTWRAVHNQSLNFLVLATGLHLAMNWSSVRRYFVQRLRG